MNKRLLKEYAYFIKRLISDNTVQTNESLRTNTFLYFIFLKLLFLNGLIEEDELNNQRKYHEKINELSISYPSLFSSDYVYINDNEQTFNNYSFLCEPLAFSFLFQYFINDLKEEASKYAINNQKIPTKMLPAATQVFTPEWIVKYMANNTVGMLLGLDDLDYLVKEKKQNIFVKDIKVVDPCMGTGNILLYCFNLLLRKYKSDGYNDYDAIKSIMQNNLYGYEIDEMAYKVCLMSFIILSLKSGVKLKEDDFKNLILLKTTNNIGSLSRNAGIKENFFDVVITNPPYMGKKSLCANLSDYLEKEYPVGKSELYASFILRCLELAKKSAYVSMITLHTWMFISSFANLRRKILNECYLESMVHTGPFTFDDLNSFNALSTIFIIKKEKFDEKSLFIKLNHIYDYELKQTELFNKDNYYYVNTNDFFDIPGFPFIYYAPKKVFSLFVSNKKVKDLFTLKQGLATGNNEEFVRYWFEVDKNKIGFGYKNVYDATNSGYKWFPYNKGGKYCKWYGNNEYVLKFDKESFRELSKQGNKLPSKEYYFKEGITWSLFGFENFSVRYKETGFIFDVSGSSLFTNEKYLYYVLGFLGSKVCFYFLSLLAPTVNFQVGNIGDLPILINDEYINDINKLVIDNIKMCKEYWNMKEISWDYRCNPIISESLNIEEGVFLLNNKLNYLSNKLRNNEERLNEIFGRIYKIDDLNVFSNDVCDRDLTIKKLDKEKSLKNLIVYLVGIIFGRYDLKGYKPRLYISFDELEKEIYNVLKVLSRKNYEDNVKYLKKELKFNFNKDFLKHLDILFHKRPIYIRISIASKKYLVYYHTINKALKSLGEKGILLNTDDGIERNIILLKEKNYLE